MRPLLRKKGGAVVAGYGEWVAIQAVSNVLNPKQKNVAERLIWARSFNFSSLPLGLESMTGERNSVAGFVLPFAKNRRASLKVKKSELRNISVFSVRCRFFFPTTCGMQNSKKCVNYSSLMFLNHSKKWKNGVKEILTSIRAGTILINRRDHGTVTYTIQRTEA